MTPEIYVAGVAARGAAVRTLFDEGEMQWRMWGEGPAVLLLHGGYGSWTHWIRNVLPLSKRFKVLAPDMPGYGTSDAPSGEINAHRLAAIIHAGLDELIGESASVAFAGFSFGGVMAGHLAAQMPDRIRRLVLLGAGGLALPRPTPPKLMKWQEATTDEERRQAHRANLNAVMIADPARIDDLAVFLQSQNTNHARVRSRSVSLTDALVQQLDRLSCPLGGIWGESDAMTGPYVDLRRDLIRRFDPDAPFEVVPGAGHWVQYEASSAVNALLLDWLA